MRINQDIKVAVDAVVIGYHERALQVLLIRRKIPPHEGRWALPGGFLLNHESLEAAVYRELQEETGVKIDYLEQLYTYGAPRRDSRFRVVSVAYYALVRSVDFLPNASTDAEEARWMNARELPALAFDHDHIVDYALERLKNKLTYEPIGFDLLNKKFLFSELEDLYTTVLDRPLDRRNFRKKMLSFGILEELPEKVSEGRGRPATLYKFNKKKYFTLREQGFLFEIR